MSNISQLENVPEISFIENLTLQETEDMVMEQYNRFYKELTGSTPDMGKADVKRLILKSFSLIMYQIMQYIDAKGRSELLKTSTGESLDALAALLGITRSGPTKAIATERFTLSAVRGEYTPIPAGTRVKSENGLYFNTLDYAEIPAGQTAVDVMIQAEQAGSDSSGIAIGSINTLVDPIPYVASVTNIDVSAGGVDAEDDYSLTERTYLATSKFSSAGPRDAYEYYVREWRSDVSDVVIDSPTPCVINVYATVEGTDGKRKLTPTERESLAQYLSGESIRPLGDKVTCLEPEDVDYKITLTYWIGRSGQKSAGTIREKVASAVEGYKVWQCSLGRDINPSELIARIKDAGAKRVKVTLPEDVVVNKKQLPNCIAAEVIYGGLEDD